MDSNRIMLYDQYSLNLKVSLESYRIFPTVRNKGQKHSLTSHLDGFPFQISLEQTVYVSCTVFKPLTTEASVKLCSVSVTYV